MSVIAIVDDNKEQRETLSIRLSMFLKKKDSKLNVIDIFPFKTYDEYYPWIENNEISVLILDEYMHNESPEGEEPVGYRGNDLVVKIRERYKYLPIFTVTAHVDDDDLQARFSEFEYIIGREAFDEKYIDIIIRAGQRYVTENQRELSMFDDLTRKIATGKGEPDDMEKLKALQLKLHIPLSNDLKDREDWLQEYGKQVGLLEEIKFVLEQKARNQ
jgi:CheY-like chemotaxis protein